MPAGAPGAGTPAEGAGEGAGTGGGDQETGAEGHQLTCHANKRIDELAIRHRQEWDEQESRHGTERRQLEERHRQQLDGLDVVLSGESGEKED